MHQVGYLQRFLRDVNGISRILDPDNVGAAVHRMFTKRRGVIYAISRMWTVNFVDLAQERDEKWALMNTVTKVTIKENVGHS